MFTIIILLLVPTACTSYDHDQPDTPANRAGFERHFGVPTPDTITEIYYYADELGADVMYQLGFKAPPEVIEELVAGLELLEQDLFHPHLAREFDWWNPSTVDALSPYWKTTSEGDYYWIFWYDPVTQRAYYLEFSL